ncbi:uncharacterized protein LOC114324850 [Diabrotica virgifera virgifera]|uniref:Uncharacterized protein LOC114324850 n=1 Tax=Diabrotica virgifera virgifera TaxID=50390 RepID=A0A6P7F3V2_DIAVI|nr:uncharacterized protein LOC114324850 [Diabrotica virgifera virgifera]XP_050507120.1 uncharacterized protein LOC114324850 [Diabrotica virgifera virgifera]XP_050507121.1 uncharacterized protein LOC114324850 [Diabrotica virgifera virgifera]
MLIYLCPADKKYSCPWEGRSEEILHHFEENHEDLLHFHNNFDIDLHEPSENHLLFVEEEIYLAQTVLEERRRLEVRLRFLGPAQIAKAINYNILVRVNYELCHPKYIAVKPDGTIVVNIEQIEKDLGEVNFLDCTFIINKNLLEDIIEVVPLNQQVEEENTNEDEFDNIFEEVETMENTLPYMPNRKYSYNEYHPKKGVSLSRAQTITLSDLKNRTFKRAKSTLSLGAISEIDGDTYTTCPQCGNSIRPPIFLCDCGYRNSSLEENFGRFLLHCKYKKYGCPQKLLSTELKDHEINCTFCDYQCPIEGCAFEGQFKHICKHFKLIHGTKKILESFIVTFHTIPEAFLVNEEKGVFYTYVKYFDDRVTWEAKFCGPKEKGFFCELKFKERKLKHPVLLNRNESVYSITMTLQELKKDKLKAKNAILTITC